MIGERKREREMAKRLRGSRVCQNANRERERDREREREREKKRKRAVESGRNGEREKWKERDGTFLSFTNPQQSLQLLITLTIDNYISMYAYHAILLLLSIKSRARIVIVMRTNGRKVMQEYVNRRIVRVRGRERLRKTERGERDRERERERY